MSSRFFEYCSIDVERALDGSLIVRRERPSIALVLLVLLPLGLIAGLLIERARPSGEALGLLLVLLIGAGLYCIESYRSIRPRTWRFDQAREVNIDGERTLSFVRLLRVEVDQQRVRGSRGARYTRFTLTLCWLSGPERAFVSRLGSEVLAAASEIADYTRVPLLHTGEGRELQALYPS